MENCLSEPRFPFFDCPFRPFRTHYPSASSWEEDGGVCVSLALSLSFLPIWLLVLCFCLKGGMVIINEREVCVCACLVGRGPPLPIVDQTDIPATMFLNFIYPPSLFVSIIIRLF